MRVGILTFHRAHNYGAVLQCYALQEVLKKMGHEVEVIDYRQSWTEEVYKSFSFRVMKVWCKTVRSSIGYIRRFPQRYVKVKKFQKCFESFNNKFIVTSGLYHYSDTLDYDVCIVGSDQLWGMSCLGEEFDDVYLGNFKTLENAKIVGYAISSNLMSIDYLNKHNRLLPSLKNFSSISFRESAIINRIKEITGIEYHQCLDPTLLSDKSIWRPLLKREWSRRKYVVCYRARGNGNSSFSVEQTAKDLANEHGWEVIDLYKNVYDVEDFVSSIANAQFVVTTSFHATVFSLIFQRPLAAYLLHDGHDSRYEDILRKLHCEQFIYEVSEKPRINQNIDWNLISKDLISLKQESLKFLTDNLK